MQGDRTKMELIVGAEHQKTPAGYPDAVLLKNRDLVVFRVDIPYDLLKFLPAAKVYDAEKYEKTPLIPEKAGEHDRYEQQCCQGSFFECGSIDRHGLLFKFLFLFSQKRYVAAQLLGLVNSGKGLAGFSFEIVQYAGYPDGA